MKKICLSLAVLLAAMGACAEEVATNVIVCAPLVQPIQTQTFELTYASAPEVAEMINTMWRGSAAPDWGVAKVAAAMSDVNMVAVTAPAPVIDACASLVKRLDKKPHQVFVEARFVELSAAAERNLGVHWGLLENVGVNSASFNMNYSHRSGDTISTETISKVGDYTVKATGKDEPETTTFAGTLSSTDMNLLLAAFEESADVNVFQNPRVIVTSGRKARVDMTTKRPNVIVSAKRVVNGANNTLDADMRMEPIPGSDKLMFAGEAFFSWGVELEVLPRVLTNDLISVEIVPTISEVNSYVTVKAGDDSSVPYSEFPIVQLQRIVSDFTMKAGTTAVIGGLSHSEEVDGDSGIPWLQDIPWIGKKLFGYRGRSKVQKEIIVFVTVGMADPEGLREDVGLPKNAVLGRQYTTGVEQEPGDRKNAVKGVNSLDLRDLDERDAPAQ